jgi:hypothetical protein
MPTVASKLPVASTLSPFTSGFQAQLRTLRLWPPVMVETSLKFVSE